MSEQKVLTGDRNQSWFWVGERWAGVPFGGRWQTHGSDLNGEGVDIPVPTEKTPQKTEWEAR